MLSRAEEDYLKAILELGDEHGNVTTSMLAERVKVRPASVTGMVQKLARQRPLCVKYESHRGVSLTPTGRRIASARSAPRSCAASSRRRRSTTSRSRRSAT